MGQEQIRRTRNEESDPTPENPPTAPVAQVSGVDAVLDEIDGVLEQNAETFVRGFVQKGGQ